MEFFFSLYRCDSTAKLKAQLNGLKSLTSDSTTFKKIYRYAFDFCRVSLYSYNNNNNNDIDNTNDNDNNSGKKQIRISNRRWIKWFWTFCGLQFRVNIQEKS